MVRVGVLPEPIAHVRAAPTLSSHSLGASSLSPGAAARFEYLRSLPRRPPSPADSYEQQEEPYYGADDTDPLPGVTAERFSAQQRRRDAEARNWGNARDTILSQLIDGQAQQHRQNLNQALHDQPQQAITAAAEQAVCLDCGNESSVVVKHRQVTYVTFEGCLEVTIPVFRCG